MERVFVQSPWTFDKKLILVVRFEGDLQPNAVQFTHSAFWIRVYNLPIKSMIREVGEDISRDIGRIIEVDVPENGLGWGRFLRIRVDIDVMEPLQRGCMLEGDEGEGSVPMWVDFKYEHQPIFCYRCGKLGHSCNECIEGRRSNRTEEIVGENGEHGSRLLYYGNKQCEGLVNLLLVRMMIERLVNPLRPTIRLQPLRYRLTWR